MKILFLQEAPCIRNWKMAVALRGKEHHVALGYVVKTINGMYGLPDESYSENIKIQNVEHLRAIVRSYDVVHCHNEPDALTVKALSAMRPPVIHDTHDMISLRGPANTNLERAANVGSAGRIYTSNAQLNAAEAIYDIDIDHSLVFHNLASRSMSPDILLPKLSLVDGKTHIVYEGSVSDEHFPHRYYIPLFRELVEAGIHLHVYATRLLKIYTDLMQKFPRLFHFYDTISPLDLISRISQYDYGIAPLIFTDANRIHLNSVMPNKPFEYLSAGLGLIIQNADALKTYWEDKDVAIFFDTAEDIITQLADFNPVPADIERALRHYEDEIGILESFYEKIIDGDRKEQHRVAAAALAEIFPDRQMQVMDGEDGEDAQVILYQRLEKIVSYCSGDVLDVGCGHGRLRKFLPGKCSEVEDEVCLTSLSYSGLDITPDAIREASKIPLADIRFGWADEMPYPDCVFDTVVMAEILEHVPDPAEALLEAARVLRKDGKVVITVPVNNPDNPCHVRQLSKPEWAAMIEKEFSIEIAEQVSVYWFFVASKAGSGNRIKEIASDNEWDALVSESPHSVYAHSSRYERFLQRLENRMA